MTIDRARVICPYCRQWCDAFPSLNHGEFVIGHHFRHRGKDVCRTIGELVTLKPPTDADQPDRQNLKRFKRAVQKAKLEQP